MAEIHGRLGPLPACHVIQRAGPQPHPGMLTSHPPDSRRLRSAHRRRAAYCRFVPSRPRLAFHCTPHDRLRSIA
jgi:hypothetical protein